MQTRILDLDGSLLRQKLLIQQSQATILPLEDRGPSIRLACGHGSFRRFQDRLTHLTGSERDSRPFLSFIGSGDFHHISLALLRRLRGPCNLLVLDNHPDWMRGIPFLHCGTWLYHAAQLSGVRRIFHIGGDVDFDNAYRWLAPWSMLRSGKIVVSPSRRHFEGRQWARIKHGSLRQRAEEPTERERIEDWLAPFRADLADFPLYISLDKDVLTASETSVNWDSGHLRTREALNVAQAFLDASDGNLAGMDVVGDWSPVRVRGLFRRFLHWTEHPPLTIDPEQATRRNEALNLLLHDRFGTLRSPGLVMPQLASGVA
jgi:arginase family enzyme